MIETIVVGTDGSDTAAQAVVQAGELAEKLGAALVIVSAFDPVSTARLNEERVRGAGRRRVGDQRA